MYRVNDIFYSLQGEGFWTGTPMVFLRLSDCNLRCPFCDTDFSASREMTAEGIVSALEDAASDRCRRVCITGGEPSLQLDTPLVDALHEAGFIIHLETNGTRTLPPGIDWITLSPKEDFSKNARVVLQKADELKLVYTGENDPSKWRDFPASEHYLQPCDPGEICPADGGVFRSPDSEGEAVEMTGETLEKQLFSEAVDTVSATLKYALSHPEWRVSLQIHKILGIA